MSDENKKFNNLGQLAMWAKEKNARTMATGLKMESEDVGKRAAIERDQNAPHTLGPRYDIRIETSKRESLGFTNLIEVDRVEATNIVLIQRGSKTMTHVFIK